VHADARAGARTAFDPGAVDDHARGILDLIGAAVRRSVVGPAPTHDGRGVHRDVVPKAMLEFARPSLRGKLDAPEAGTPPPGVELRTDDSGARILTINIHGGAPGDMHDRTAGDEDIAQLRDVARYVNSVDPDVVLVQELRNHPLLTWPGRVAEQASVLHHLFEADDMVFTPAFREFDGTQEGTAIYTRNGYEIERAVNIELPDGDATQERGAGIARVVAPDGTDYTVVGTHLAHKSTDGPSRAKQLDVISDVLRDLRAGGSEAGSFEYRERDGGRSRTASGFPTERIVLGGDLNSLQDNADGVRNSPDEILGDAGLVHVNTQLRTSDDPAVRANLPGAEQRTSTKRRIDHVYTHGLEVRDATVAEIPAHDLPEGTRVSDHRGVVVDLGRVER
jgi:endonuclease/exonuclease/phosphatase family metal-dependent hydrolase